MEGGKAVANLKKLLCICLVMALCLALVPAAMAEEEPVSAEYVNTGEALIRPAADGAAASVPAHLPSWYTEQGVRERLLAMQSAYPEGMPWTNDNSYVGTYFWHGGEFDNGWVTVTAGGCAAFGLLMSDAAFGSDMPIWEDSDVSFSEVRAGDLLRLNDDTHTVVVLEVNKRGVVIAEGNYNYSVHWGRALTAAEVESADYRLTRWQGMPVPVPGDANGDWSADARDSALILLSSVGLCDGISEFADADGNGRITPRDAARLLPAG